MAREESDREDLLREATALVERCELRVDSFPGFEVVAGFRRNGALSIYFGVDPVVQFDPQGRLRRGYWQGDLLKAEAGRLVRLQKQRTQAESLFVRTDLDQAEVGEILRVIQDQLMALSSDLAANRYQLVGQVPADVDVVARLRRALEHLPRPIEIADRPHADG